MCNNCLAFCFGVFVLMRLSPSWYGTCLPNKKKAGSNPARRSMSVWPKGLRRSTANAIYGGSNPTADLCAFSSMVEALD